MKRKIEYFDNKAEHWQKNNRETEKILIADIFENYVTELNGEILDLGCGAGFLIPFIKKQMNGNNKLYCADYSIQMLNKLKDMNFNCNVIRCDAHDLPFDKCSLSTVFCYNVFPHFENKIKIISELKRVLRYEGKIYVMHNMNHKKLNNIHAEKGKEVSRDKMPPVNHLKELFSQHSFQVTNFEEKENRYLLIAKS